VVFFGTRCIYAVLGNSNYAELVDSIRLEISEGHKNDQHDVLRP